MKKLLCLLLCLALPLAAMAEVAPLTAEDFIITVGDGSYLPGEEAAPLVDALEALTGAPLNMTVTASCMFDGMDCEYFNDAVLVGTYPIGENGSDVIESIMVFTDTLRTERGAAVGMTRAEIEALYGEDYFLDWDTMIYAMGELQPQIMFTLDLDTDVVVSWMLLRNTVA